MLCGTMSLFCSCVLGRGNVLITQTGWKGIGQLELWKQGAGTVFGVNSQIQYPNTVPYTLLLPSNK